MPTQNFIGNINGVVPNQIIGNGIAGRVLRSSTLIITNAVLADRVKCSTVPVPGWIGDTNVAQDNIPKGGTAGVWSMDASGYNLGLSNAGITGDPVTVLSGSVTFNASGTAIVVIVYTSGGDISFLFRDAATGANVDLSTLVDIGDILVNFLYLTSA